VAPQEPNQRIARRRDVHRQQRGRRLDVAVPAGREDLPMLVVRAARIVGLDQQDTVVAVDRVVER